MSSNNYQISQILWGELMYYLNNHWLSGVSYYILSFLHSGFGGRGRGQWHIKDWKTLSLNAGLLDSILTGYQDAFNLQSYKKCKIAWSPQSIINVTLTLLSLSISGLRKQPCWFTTEGNEEANSVSSPAYQPGNQMFSSTLLLLRFQQIQIFLQVLWILIGHDFYTKNSL